MSAPSPPALVSVALRPQRTPYKTPSVVIISVILFIHAHFAFVSGNSVQNCGSFFVKTDWEIKKKKAG